VTAEMEIGSCFQSTMSTAPGSDFYSEFQKRKNGN